MGLLCYYVNSPFKRFQRLIFGNKPVHLALETSFYGSADPSIALHSNHSYIGVLDPSAVFYQTGCPKNHGNLMLENRFFN